MYIGIDLGTSSIKTILIDELQNTLCAHTEKIKIDNPKTGYYEQDPENWYKAAIKCLKKIKQEKPRELSAVKSLGISGQMHGSVLIDKSNKVIRPCILWNDSRSAQQCNQMEKKYSQLRKITGNIAMPGFTAPKILWIKQNEKNYFKKIHKVLLPKDYLRFKLSNSYYTDMSDASGTLWLDVKKRIWSDEMLNLTYLTKDNMPTLVEGSDATGYVNKKISNMFGFNNQVIIAGGAGDQAAGAAGSGVINPYQSVISLGTSGVYFSPTKKFVSNTKDAVHSFCHCIPNTWHHMSVMLSATNCLDWISKIMNLRVEDCFKRFEKLSTRDLYNKSLPFFLPYLTGERTPHNNPFLRGSFHKLDTSVDIDEIFYSVVEGITFGIKDGFEAVHAVSAKSKEIFVVGGGSKSKLWAKIISSTINKEIFIGEDANLGPALGAARLAMLASQNYSYNEVFKRMKIVKKCSINDELSKNINERYITWKKIVKENMNLAKDLMEK